MARRRSSRSKSTGEPKPRCAGTRLDGKPCGRDRKSTRLNSSHSQISYAVFCLKKKKKLGTTRRVGDRAFLVFSELDKLKDTLTTIWCMVVRVDGFRQACVILVACNSEIRAVL